MHIKANPIHLTVAMTLALNISPVQASTQFTVKELSLEWLGDSATSYASDINNHGLVAGFTSESGLDEKGQLWQGNWELGLVFSSQRTIPKAVNDSGWVVGSYTYPSLFDNKGFLFNGHEKIDLGSLGGSYTSANGINASGAVVGGSEHADGSLRGFLWQNNVMTSLGTLGGNFSVANGVNDQHDIVGSATNSDGVSRAVIWKEGSVLDVGALEGARENADANALAINNAGQITGYARNAQGVLHAYLGTSNGMIDLMPDYSGTSFGHAINDLGHVVGLMSSNFSGSRAFYWDGELHDLNDLIPENSGWTLRDARGINDLGQIVGDGFNPEGQYRAFILTPVPEPTTLAMMLSGVFVLAIGWRKRHSM
jgi:probable HAF family extracellular repeat protein